MTEEESRFMQNFCIGAALVFLSVVLMVIVNSCEKQKPKTIYKNEILHDFYPHTNEFCYVKCKG